MGMAYYSIWIPRSYMHLRRLYAYLKDQYEITIKKTDYDLSRNVFSCEIEYLERNITMEVDEDGLFLFQTRMRNDDLAEYMESMFLNLLKKVLSVAMPVIKNQIEEGLMPLQQQLMIQTPKIKKPEGYVEYVLGSQKLLTNRETNYEKKVVIYHVSKKPFDRKFLKLYFFIKAYEHVLLDMSDKMVELFRKTGAVNKQLENHEMDIETLKEITRYLADKSKDVSLMHSRLDQMKNNYENKLKQWKHYGPGSSERKIAKQLSLDDRYEYIKKDFDYVKNLWNLLGEFMDRSLHILEITTSRQDAVESNKIQALVSAEAAQIIAASLLSIILAEGIDIPPKFQAIGTIGIWILLFLVISGFFKIIRARRKMRLLLR